MKQEECSRKRQGKLQYKALGFKKVLWQGEKFDPRLREVCWHMYFTVQHLVCN